MGEIGISIYFFISKKSNKRFACRSKLSEFVCIRTWGMPFKCRIVQCRHAKKRVMLEGSEILGRWKLKVSIGKNETFFNGEITNLSELNRHVLQVKNKHVHLNLQIQQNYQYESSKVSIRFIVMLIESIDPIYCDAHRNGRLMETVSEWEKLTSACHESASEE